MKETTGAQALPGKRVSTASDRANRRAADQLVGLDTTRTSRAQRGPHASAFDRTATLRNCCSAWCSRAVPKVNTKIISSTSRSTIDVVRVDERGAVGIVGQEAKTVLLHAQVGRIFDEGRGPIRANRSVEYGQPSRVDGVKRDVASVRVVCDFAQPLGVVQTGKRDAIGLALNATVARRSVGAVIGRLGPRCSSAVMSSGRTRLEAVVS